MAELWEQKVQDTQPVEKVGFSELTKTDRNPGKDKTLERVQENHDSTDGS